MDVTSTKAATAAATSAKTGAKTDETEGATSALTGDFDTFLKLLTTQMKNQDPLQPMESTEFVAQLAAFSSVEQQIGSNTRLDSILDALAGRGADGYAAWIGKEVLAPASASFTGDPIEITVTPKDDADSATLVVKNDFGRVVDRQTVAPTSGTVTWDGTFSLGAPVANGLYSFALESYSGETLLDTQQGQVYAKVAEVRLDDKGAAMLVLEGGGKVAPADISGVR
ncbi:flagellar hook capping FlgD N-terminal domain-containing protein [uncultured Amaricoccus sp.]|uniref:flagellar hook capping FlgD N-terminal domain-containing protein n=1 Tax=uncultured Amaricoccus sp. TaxID=339341 RepID=UPI00263459EA|nr:flagellar hook capping FlgD N-terminal domain-containing protein [uncultured Amaricoccus sp.]